jgi:hypothetical protein
MRWVAEDETERASSGIADARLLDLSRLGERSNGRPPRRLAIAGAISRRRPVWVRNIYTPGTRVIAEIKDLPPLSQDG